MVTTSSIAFLPLLFCAPIDISPDKDSIAGGDLNSITAALNKVTGALDAAADERDPAKAAAKVAEAIQAFNETVDAPLDGMIQGLEQQIADYRKEERGKAEEQRRAAEAPRKGRFARLNSLLLARDRAELARVKMYIYYARKLSKAQPERKVILEKGHKLASNFVENRYDFYIMQYDAQLQRGICAYELGRHAEAAESLKVLFDAKPQARPFSPEIIEVFKEYRLQAILFGARSLIKTRKYEEAVKSIEKSFLKPSGDEFDLTKLSPALEPLADLVKREYEIALTRKPQEKG